jgi:hypothetical protein
MPQGAEEDEMRAEQEVLGGALERLGRRLHQHTTADAILTTETLLMVLVILREWLETGVVLGAVEAAGRARLEAWEEQLAAGGAYLGALRQAIQSELALSSFRAPHRHPAGSPPDRMSASTAVS